MLIDVINWGAGHRGKNLEASFYGSNHHDDIASIVAANVSDGWERARRRLAAFFDDFVCYEVDRIVVFFPRDGLPAIFGVVRSWDRECLAIGVFLCPLLDHLRGEPLSVVRLTCPFRVSCTVH